ncbi:MAG: PhoU domain-containing protein [Promethearchaeota archaeon]|jgi:phosphate uptake regulator
MGELRKIQRTPTGTFFVCLPRPWAIREGIKKGELVTLIETNDGKILIDPNNELNKLPKITTLKAGPYLSREIIGRYLLGFDIISIEAKDNINIDVRNKVKKAVHSLIGLEIFEETYSKIVLQCLLQPSSLPPERILRRIYNIIAGMNRDAVNSFIHGDLSLANSVAARDDDSNRLYFLLVRILRTIIQNPSLSEKLGVSPIDCLDYRLAASLIEAIGDLSVKIALKTLEPNRLSPSADLQKLIQASQTLIFRGHKQALQAFLNKDIILANKVRKLSEKIESLFVDIEKASKNAPFNILPQILATTSLMRQTYENSVDLADLVV